MLTSNGSISDSGGNLLNMFSCAILGSTGSIGTQALDIVKRYPDRLNVLTLAAGTRIELLAEQIRTFHPKAVAVKGPEETKALRNLLGVEKETEIVWGADGLEYVTCYKGVDTVLNGLVGAIGLVPTLAALRSNLRVLLANKESLVMAGELIRGLIDSGHGSLIPVDSEHSAIFQCLGGTLFHPGLSRIILTASGGPFRDRPIEEFDSITLDEALSHPTWKMGRKITIDSATLMNKGLEIIEANYLFGLPPDKIEVVIHPASIVHSFVEFRDGSILAQMSRPTMEIPIQYALLGGERHPTTVESADPGKIGTLEFYPPDSKRFPALNLARQALEMGGTAPAVLNGANEEAVGLFLDKMIPYKMIAEMVRSALEAHEVKSAGEEEIINSDIWAREHVRRILSGVG